MSNQLRKFEQDAITNEILSDLSNKAKLSQSNLELGSGYRSLQKTVDTINEIKNQREYLSEKMKEHEKSLEDKIKYFNTSFDENYGIRFQNHSYSNSPVKLYWETSSHHLRNQVEQKLALALISPDWKDRLAEIIQSITDQLSGGIK